MSFIPFTSSNIELPVHLEGVTYCPYAGPYRAKPAEHIIESLLSNPSCWLVWACTSHLATTPIVTFDNLRLGPARLLFKSVWAFLCDYYPLHLPRQNASVDRKAALPYLAISYLRQIQCVVAIHGAPSPIDWLPYLKTYHTGHHKEGKLGWTMKCYSKPQPLYPQGTYWVPWLVLSWAKMPLCLWVTV